MAYVMIVFLIDRYCIKSELFLYQKCPFVSILMRLLFQGTAQTLAASGLPIVTVAHPSPNKAVDACYRCIPPPMP